MQTVLVILLITGAVAYLGLRFYRSWAGKKQQGCEKCGTPDNSAK